MTTRREFLGRALGGAAFCAAFGLAGCGGVPVLRGSASGGRILVSREQLDALGEDGGACAVDAPELAVPLLLVRAPDGTFHALSSECTHQACRLNPGKGFLTCPCHGSVFDLEGQVVRGPARAPLPAFPVRTTDAGVEIDVSRGAAS